MMKVYRASAGIDVSYQSKILCSDNINFMKSLEKDSMNLIVTSPPYNLGKEYETKTSLDIYLEEQSSAIEQAVRLLHPTGSICWQVGNYVEKRRGFSIGHYSLQIV